LDERCDLEDVAELLAIEARNELILQGVSPERVRVARRVHLKYDGTDTALIVDLGPLEKMKTDFEAAYRQQFSFLMPSRALVAEAVSVEAIAPGDAPVEPSVERKKAATPVDRVRMFTAGAWHETPLYRRDELAAGQRVDGPAIIAEANATTVVEPEWRLAVTERDHLVLERAKPRKVEAAIGTQVDPVRLEIFNNLFMSIAEQMGLRLQNTAYSVNIKERLDFSCAIFDAVGNLIANAPHMPVHLGSMGESIKTVISENRGMMRPGDVFMLNDPYHGGTHLPDVTVITPVFDKDEILFYVGSRGPHSHLGDITPRHTPRD